MHRPKARCTPHWSREDHRMTPGTAITFFYYPDLSAVIPFYEETLAFELVLDQAMRCMTRLSASMDTATRVAASSSGRRAEAGAAAARPADRAFFLRGSGRLRDRGAALPRPGGGRAVRLKVRPPRRRPGKAPAAAPIPPPAAGRPGGLCRHAAPSPGCFGFRAQAHRRQRRPGDQAGE